MKGAVWTVSLVSKSGARTPVAILSQSAVGVELRNTIAAAIASSFHTRVAISDARPNPTLVHHGLAKAAAFHLTAGNKPLADLYTTDRPTVNRVAHALADQLDVQVSVLNNKNLPRTLAEHPRRTVRSARGNPHITPAFGQVWRGPGGMKARILAIEPRRVSVLHLGSGEREWIPRGDFDVSWKRAQPVRINPSRSKRAVASRAKTTATRKRLGRRLYRSSLKAIRRPARPGNAAQSLYYLQHQAARSARRKAGLRPNPSGRYIVRKVKGPTPTGVGTGTIHEVVDTHGNVVVMRSWNGSDASSQARYLNKYGPEKSKRPPDHPAHRNPGDYVPVAESAKQLRIALKRHFPKVKFSVRSKSYAGGASIRVAYENGPRADDVDRIAQRFAGADFDGMTDLKSSRDSLLVGEDGSMRSVRYGSDFVFVERKISPALNDAVVHLLGAKWEPSQWATMHDYDKDAIARQGVSAIAIPDNEPEATTARRAVEAFFRDEGRRTNPRPMRPLSRRVRRCNAQAAARGRGRAGHNPRSPLSVGERVSVPYTGRSSYFGRKVKRTHEKAVVEGINEDGTVHVRVTRGHTPESHYFPASSVRRLPKRGGGRSRVGSAKARLEEKSRRARIRETKAAIKQAESDLACAEAKAHDMYPQAGETPSSAYRTSRSKMTKLRNVLDAQYAILHDLEGVAASEGDPFAIANPRGDHARANDAFRMWHNREPGKVTRVRGPSRVPRVLASLGTLESVTYRSNKWAGDKDNPHGKRILYEHRTKRPKPVLASDGRDVFIVGGRMKPTADGLVN